MQPSRPPLAFALDYPTLDDARRGAHEVAEVVGMLKVGLELFVLAGAEAVALGREVKLPVFLDLKLHDIPETVERAVARACGLGVRFLTVHASGGPAMLTRAVERAAREGSTCSVVAVTVLTSLDGSDLAKLGVFQDVPTHTLRLARLAWEAGVRAFVCSAQEVRAMRAELGTEAILITPGIRSASRGSDDQKRVATAEQAIADGADWLVVGRPIRDAPNPWAAALSFGREIEQAAAKQRRQGH